MHDAYYSCAQNTSVAFERTGHAIGFTFVTYNRKGNIRPAVGRLAGVYAGGIVPIAWFPSRYTYSGDGVRMANQILASTAVQNILTEFSPEVRRFFRKVFRRP